MFGGISLNPNFSFPVWIVGDSYIRRAFRRSKVSVGKNLGLTADITWFGVGGLRWGSFVCLLNSLLRSRPAPNVLVMHVGGNDLGQLKGVELVRQMKGYLLQVHERYPTVKLVFSCINMRRVWRYGPPSKVNNARVFVSNVMSTFVGTLGGVEIRHPEIKHDSAGMFLEDGVHLTDSGHDIFITNLQGGIRRALEH
ncbi:hypothetical protein ACEWY4_006029 [Coilia grayii]|uniref:SGNH hydrolase-type esterase domain-containing protein n=1 Tax=Coilia grayii TaxID=363190 RepID=A0ABD1KCD1_9TELE